MPYIYFENGEIDALLSVTGAQSVSDQVLTQAEEKLKAAKKPLSERDEKIVEIAASMRYVRGGEVEIVDGEPVISEGDDNGAYVLGWVWADFAGTELDKEAENEDAEGSGE